MDSSVSPTYGDQEGTAHNGHFGCPCYHLLFLFNRFGDQERCAVRPGNVHSADDWESVLKPVVVRYKERKVRLYFRGDAAFASPETYEYLEAGGFLYAIRLPANKALQESIAHLLSRAAERVVAFYNKRGTAEQWIKEGKNANEWTRLSCRKFRNNEFRLQLHAPAYNLGNFSRTLALPKEVAHGSLTTLREKLVKIGAKVVSHGRYITFQMAFQTAARRQN